MALQIIVKGKVVEMEWNRFYLIQDDTGKTYSLGGWALPYTNKTLVISLEEEEEELEPIVSTRLKRLFAPG